MHVMMLYFVLGAVSDPRRDGKLVGMDVTLYNNAGCSLDLSSSVMDKALYHIDNCYRCRQYTV